MGEKQGKEGERESEKGTGERERKERRVILPCLL